MATTATTLAGAVSPSDWIVTLASAAALKPGDNIVCQSETMRALVVTPGGGPAIVYRGARGTNGVTHAGGTAVTYGGPSDYGPGVGVTSINLLAAETALAEQQAEKRAKDLEEIAAKLAKEEEHRAKELAKEEEKRAKDEEKRAKDEEKLHGHRP